MLPNTLNTNEVKNAAGTEIEFQRLSTIGRKLIFAKIGESPSLPHRLTVSHDESGSGINLVRRSLTRFDYSSISQSDAVTPVVTSGYTVLVTPVGHMTDTVAAALVLANLNSFMASLGATTTILFDGTGSGSAALIAGSL